MRAGETITLGDITLSTTIHDLKSQYAQKTNLQQEKIKLLLNKKPAADLKSLKELGVEGDVELSVMIMGGTASTPIVASPAIEKGDALAAAAPPALPTEDKMDVDPPAAAPLSEMAEAKAEVEATEAHTAAKILQTEEFWLDLRGFLVQRLRDEKEGERLALVFREACGRP